MNFRFGPLGPPALPPAATPVGELCLHCDEPIEAGDSGSLMPLTELAEGPLEEGAKPGTRLFAGRIVPVHRECEIRQIAGSVGHQRGLCTCDGGPGTMDDPPGLTLRQAAVAAEREWLRRQGEVEQ